MPVIPIQDGAVLEVIFWSRLSGQRIMNTFQYKMTSPPPVDHDYRAELELVAQFIMGTNGLLEDYLPMLPTDMIVDRLTIQPVWPIRQRYMSWTIAQNGTSTFASANTANQAVSIKRTSETVGPRGVGRVQIPVPRTAVVAGLIDPAYITTEAQAMADEMLDPMVTSTPITWEPCLFSVVGGVAGTGILIGTEVETTARVMRRRTVGVGV